MAQDTAVLVEQCPDGPKVHSVVGVLDVPWDSGKGLLAVAEVASDKALQASTPDPGCSWAEATYWARDEQSRGDWVVRYSTAPDRPTSLLFVPEAGAPRTTTAEEVPVSAAMARLLRAVSYFGDVAEDAERAAQLLERALELDPTSAKLAEVQAEFWAERDPERALAATERGLGHHPKQPDLEATRAGILLAKSDPAAQAQGQALLSGLLEREPTHPKALSLRAEQAREAGNREGALADYRALLTAHPALHVARYNLATLLLDMGQSLGALDELSKYLDTYPEDGDALYLRASTALGLGRVDAARADLERLQKVAPDNPQVRALATQLDAASAPK
jgi:predicted Zn-dependent protease